MHIGIIIGSNETGGMERQACLLAKGLMEIQHNVTVFYSTPSINKTSNENSRLNFDFCNVIKLYSQLPGMKFFLKFTGPQIIKKYKLDILIGYNSGNIKTAGIMASKTGTPVIGSIRGIKFADNITSKNELKQVCGKYCHYLISNVMSTKELMIYHNIFPSGKIEVIYNGIAEPESPIPTPSQKTAFNIFFVGTLYQVKDPMTFCKAVCKAVKNNLNIRINIIGDGNMRKTMQDFFITNKISDKVTFYGKIPMEKIPYHNADLLINTSIREGCSNVILEALANGVPVIATKAGGNTEILENKIFGRLIKIKDTDKLYNYITEFVNIPLEDKKEIAAAAKKYINLNFGIKNMVNQHVTLFNQILRPEPADSLPDFGNRNEKLTE